MECFVELECIRLEKIDPIFVPGTECEQIDVPISGFSDFTSTFGSSKDMEIHEIHSDFREIQPVKY